MAQPLTIAPITGASVSINGTVLHGLIKEINIDPIKYVMGDFQAIGMIGVEQLQLGIEKVEGSMTLTSTNLALVNSLAPFGAKVQMQVSANKDTMGNTAARTRVQWQMTVTPKMIPVELKHKAQEMAEFSYEFAVSALEVIDNGQSILKYDATANILQIGGVDALSTFRNNLAI